MTETEWRTLEEQETPKQWARRVIRLFTIGELAAITAAIDPDVLRGDDDSSSARRRKRTMRPSMTIADDLAQRAAVAKLDQPFGKRAA